MKEAGWRPPLGGYRQQLKGPEGGFQGLLCSSSVWVLVTQVWIFL